MITTETQRARRSRRGHLWVTLRFVSVLCISAVGICAQLQPACRDGKCEATIKGSIPACSRLRIVAHGPVTLEGGVSPHLSYTVKLTVSARTEVEARRLLRNYALRIQALGPWTLLTAPGGAVMTAVTVRAPRLTAAQIATSDGPVRAYGIAGPLGVDTGAGAIAVDRIAGSCNLSTGGGDIEVGQTGGDLKCHTGAGRITAAMVHGAAMLSSEGGDIVAQEAGGLVRAETRGGGIRVGAAGGPVTAATGGGVIDIGRAGGPVTMRGIVPSAQVGSAAGVRCELASGGIRLAAIAGPMRVSTVMGSILANLTGSHLADSYLATANGDITVLIPSNVGVTIQAENAMADTLRRIMSDFAAVQPRRQGMRVVAAGPINGGGPLLQISGMGGTIFIKRQ